MQYRKLGRTGLKVSPLCLGTMTFGWSADEPTSFDIMNVALDAGINFFDTADVYSKWVEGNQGGEAETIIGKWLKHKDRRSVIIASKVRGGMWANLNATTSPSSMKVTTAVCLRQSPRPVRWNRSSRFCSQSLSRWKRNKREDGIQ